MPTITAHHVAPLPDWALHQRRLIQFMNQAALIYRDRYTTRDGSFIWRKQWPGMDGSDDGYESYHNWPLYYALGGSATIHNESYRLWEAVTKQFTGYGQIYREFDAYYDWMHHGESSIFFYYFGLADPRRRQYRNRTMRFARLYTGDDAELKEQGRENWDSRRRMIRSPITGSRGPRFENSWEDWSTHRWVLAGYPVPFDDLDVPVEMRPWIDGEMVPMADWEDHAVYAKILDALNRRQMRGDVPLNLTATSLLTHAFLLTGFDRYRRWVLDYLEAWAERIDRNDGICPDNVGPNDIIGELMEGKWWGGYYGWRWPHGFMTIIEPLTIAAMNAVLLTGDLSYLDIPRNQIDRLLDRGREEDGRFLVPYRHIDAGWTSWRPLRPHHAAQIWYLSQDPRDKARLDAIPETRTDWLTVQPGRGKGDDIHFGPWYCYLDGRLPDYPTRILEAQYAEVLRRMDLIRSDVSDPEERDVHHWQDRNPVHTEGLIQLTCGGPQIIYHGGLLHVRLRYFDMLARRPGLPADVAALVHGLDAESITVTLVNSSPNQEQSLIVQGGAFAEHTIRTAQDLDGEHGGAPVPVNGPHLSVQLPPGRRLRLRLEMGRFANTPTYDQPFPR